MTINAQYEIDMSQNNGLDFQYHAAVRNRQERKHLNAGDCECCRDVSTLSAIADAAVDFIRIVLRSHWSSPPSLAATTLAVS